MRRKAILSTIGFVCGAGFMLLLGQIQSRRDWHVHKDALRDFAVRVASRPFESEARVFPSKEALLPSYETTKLNTHLVYSPLVGSTTLRWEDQGSHFIAWGYQLEPGTRKRGFVTTNLSIVFEDDQLIDWVEQRFLHGRAHLRD